MKSVLGIIISFDEYCELRDITDHRAIAAVPFGGRYRIIDFMLSNMVNSGITDICVLMREKYQSLMEHLGSGKDWDLSRKRGGLTLIPPYAFSQKASPLMTGEYRGKIDALAGCIDLISNSTCEYVIVSDSDIIANIDLNKALQMHEESGKDMTFICQKSNTVKTHDLFVNIDEDGEIKDISLGDDGNGKFIYKALGISIMKRTTLLSIIAKCVTKNLKDFEHEVIPYLQKTNSMNAYILNNYSVKITDTNSYFNANLDLLERNIRYQLFLKSRPIFTKVYDEEPTYYSDEANVTESLIADGAHIEGSIENSIIFRDVIVKKGAVVKNSVIMTSSIIGQDSSTENIIIDKNVTIRKGRKLMGQLSYPVVISKNVIV